jgi:hypothetical protein
MKVLDWLIGIGLWIARLAEIVLLWVLANWAYFAGLVAMALVLITNWVAFTLSDRIRALRSSILGYSPDHPGNPLLSWGLAAALTFAVAAVTFQRKHWRLLGLAGATLLLMSLAGLLQVAFAEPALLKTLADEQSEWVGVQEFQNTYLPTAVREERSNAKGPALAASINTVWDRLVAARYFMGRAWYLTAFLGLCSFCYATAHLSSPRDRNRLMGGTLAIAICLIIGFSTRPIIGAVMVVRGHQAEAEGNPNLAIQRYRKAMRVDDWFAVHTDLYQRIGTIDANFGRIDTLEYGVFTSERLFAEGNFAEAIEALQKVEPKAGKFAWVFRSREADMWVIFGKELYKKGAVAAAIPTWQHALAKNPFQWVAAFCLARGYFEVTRYQESIAVLQQMIKGIRDPFLRAGLDDDLGDDYMRLGDAEAAKLVYRHSYLIDYVLNWRGLSDPIGAQGGIYLQASD